MSSTKTAIRYVLAFVGVFAALQPFPVLLTPPDSFTSIIVSGVVAVVSLPIAAVFGRRSYSLERLYGFLLGIYIVGFVVLALSVVVSAAIGTSSPASSGYTVEGVGFQVLLLLVAYLFSYVLVYRGGYTRLKSRFA